MLVGVVGHPIAHSLSPYIHNAALEHDGRPERYESFDVDAGRFESFVAELRTKGVRGLNVTIPHKTAAFDACTTRSAAAERARAVNVLLFDGETLGGHNTDVYGVRRALDDLGVVVEGVRVLVIGAGGAGRAAACAVAAAAGELSIANRTEGRAHTVAADLGARVVPWPDLARAVGTTDVVINATSVGLDGTGSVLDRDALAGFRGALLDLVYASGETLLVRTAKALGLVAADGLGVLVHQAAESYRLFWDTEPPIAVMHRAALAAAGRT